VLGRLKGLGTGSEGTMAEKEIRVGRHVWVSDPTNASGRSFGRIATVLADVLTGKRAGFVVEVDGRTAVVSCSEQRRGEQWDFLD
jgi:ribosomal protein L13